LKRFVSRWASNDHAPARMLILTRVQVLAACCALAGVATCASAGFFPGEYMTYWLNDGKLKVIGSNRNYEMGTGIAQTFRSICLPPGCVVAMPAGINVREVGAGGYQGAAVDTDGHVWTWGRSAEGQRGDGLQSGESNGSGGYRQSALDSEPYRVTQGVDRNGNLVAFDNVISVKSGLLFNAALRADGTVWTWGYNAFDGSTSYMGILGDGVNQPSGTATCPHVANTDRNPAAPCSVRRPTEVKLLPINNPIRQIEVSEAIFAIAQDGSLYAWGGGDLGDASSIGRGTGVLTDPSTPRKLVIAPAVSMVSSSGEATFALDVNGNLWGWGRGNSAAPGTRLGDPATSGAQTTPRLLDLRSDSGVVLNGRIKKVRTSQNAVHVLLTDHTLWSWGEQYFGEVGDGIAASSRALRPKKTLDNVADVYSHANAAFVFAVKLDGTVLSWGRNKFGVLGDGVEGAATDITSTPTAVRPFSTLLPCELDIDGDTKYFPNPSTDGVLLLRYLLGFRGASLTQGLSLSGPRTDSTSIEAFITARDYSFYGMPGDAPTATTALLLRRVTAGANDASLLGGVALTKNVSAATLRSNVKTRCALP
jgi:alpha-tubulin suppressor-like RCC1 family protein